MVPTSTSPELIPIPMRQRSPKWDSTEASMSSAAASARSAWSGQRSGAPKTPSSPSPSSLFACPPCAVRIGTTTPKNSFR